MNRQLDGKAAVVTGSTSGVGKEIASQLAAAGCDVVINGFGESLAIEAFKLGLEAAHGVRVVFHGADLTQPSEVAEMMVFAADTVGEPDILVNNAGIQHVSPIETFPVEMWDRILALNLSAAFHTIRLAMPAMRRRKWGRIINIASVHGLVASPFKAAYISAKHGLIGLTKAVALEAAKDGITCNAICPGFVHTPLMEGQIDDQARATGIPRERIIEEVILAKHVKKEFVKAEHIAAWVTMLCTDAGSSTTGASLAMDAGWTAV
ncbi:3-hydroxybutyrate dehydrogenase [Verrucomicrobia bacterium LW23]|nr:3-hydroxybutyrate dehydrogenase [Verrucomicrobia bacterium LW23]